MSQRAEQVANAVLYEGYMLYPYRPSAVKNRQRFNFGVVYPEGSKEGPSSIETQCLTVIRPGTPAALDVKVRFLHLCARTSGDTDAAWQEAVECEVLVSDYTLGDAIIRSFAFPANRSRDGRIVREQQRLEGLVELSAEKVEADLLRIAVDVRNLTPLEATVTRDAELLRSLVSVHTILSLRGAEFVSLIDPPEAYRLAAEQCRNTGTWPVLVGEEGERNVMLSSPIILYDYPQIAPESPGDLCDGTEIDEILSLRILTLTDEEKREMRHSDERARRILERTEALPEERWMKLHGVLRGLRPGSEVIR